VRKRTFLPLLLALVPAFGFTQQTAAPTGPKIVIELPRNIEPEKVWIRYILSGPDAGGRISGGETLKVEPNYRHSIPALYESVPARHARIVLYAAGCQFETYDLDLNGDSDITRTFHCDPLPTKKVYGFLNLKEFPTPLDPAEKKLDIEGHLDGAWICEYFFQPRPDQTGSGGSCLGSTVPLGLLGELDPGDKGIFEVTIPDFTRDPVFDRFARGGKFGVIELPLKEKKLGRGLATIKAEDSPELGLNVQAEYPDPVIFTRVHH
jgi:hypothetical protein